LKEIKNKEIETDKNKPVNLLIEGDNYHSLAVLNFTHQKRVDCIYIDPPYNTGNNDFRYNDKFVEKEDPWRHSKWLSFMEKRLKLAKGLLKDSGAIFISIDENEVAQLKMLCDEIFGENNFESIVSWRRRSNQPNDKAKMIAKVSEFILVYAKSSVHLKESKFFNTLSLSEKRIQAYSNPDDDPRGAWSTTPWCASRGQGGTKYEIITPTKIKYNETWLGTKDTFNNLLVDKRIVFPNNGNGKPRKKVFLKERQEEGQSAINFWFGNAYGDNLVASAELNNIFGGDRVFDNPKPTSLIKTILKLKTNKNDLIVDFFAGSGTTGQAVFELNKEDGGNRKFILCTNNENNICTDVCYPRVEKVINGYKNLKGEKNAGLGGNLKYFKTDFVGSDSTDKNRRDLVNKSAEMICIKEDIFDLVVDGGFDYKIYQKGKKFLGVIFDIDAIVDFKKEAEKHKGNFVVYCFSYTEATPEKEFKGLKNKYVLKPIPAIILRIYSEIFRK
jgi:adenine-specific DNA-methyltransferase